MQIVPRLSKSAAQNSPKHGLSGEKFSFFLGRGLAPKKAFWIRICVPRKKIQPDLRLCGLCGAVQSLYCDVRHLLTYVKEIHGGTFRRVALAALIDALKHPQTASAHKSKVVRSARRYRLCASGSFSPVKQ